MTHLESIDSPPQPGTPARFRSESVCGIVVASCHNKAQLLELQLELLLPAGLLAKIPYAS